VTNNSKLSCVNADRFCTMPNSNRLNLIFVAAFLSLLAGCDLINSFIGGGGGGEEPAVTESPATAPSPQAASPSPAASPAPPPPPAASPAQAPQAAQPPAAPASKAPFKDAVSKAIAAAQLTQKAKTAQEWQTVVQDWQAAISLMKAVPQGDPNYAVAQQKAAEYQKYLQYAQKNAGR
jgi:hypothetical protein